MQSSVLIRRQWTALLCALLSCALRGLCTVGAGAVHSCCCLDCWWLLQQASNSDTQEHTPPRPRWRPVTRLQGWERVWSVHICTGITVVELRPRVLLARRASSEPSQTRAGLLICPPSAPTDPICLLYPSRHRVGRHPCAQSPCLHRQCCRNRVHTHLTPPSHASGV